MKSCLAQRQSFIAGKIVSVSTDVNDHTCTLDDGTVIIVTDAVQTPEADDFVVFYNSTDDALPNAGTPVIVLAENASFAY